MHSFLTPELCRQHAIDRRAELQRTAHIARVAREARQARREQRRQQREHRHRRRPDR